MITSYYYTPTLLCARITHFQPCTITQSSERISGQKLSISYLARILSFCPILVSRFCDVERMINGRAASSSDYYIVTSYLNAINLLNYSDICLLAYCLYKQYAIPCQQNVTAMRWSIHVITWSPPGLV